MAGQIESGVAKAAGIVGILVLICGIADCICGFIWIGYGGPGGHGLWSGFGVGLLLSLVSLVLPFCVYATGTAFASGYLKHSENGKFSQQNVATVVRLISSVQSVCVCVCVCGVCVCVCCCCLCIPYY